MLKRATISTVLLIGLVMGAGQVSYAQKTVRFSVTPPAFQDFFKQFVWCVRRNDLNRIAAMTRFPFKYGFDAGDEGVWTKKQFLNKAQRFLDPKRNVVKSADPEFTVSGVTYTLTDNDNAAYYTFKKTGRVFKFVSYIVEP